jgi:dihydroorotate dehydrogenase (fumarate)
MERTSIELGGIRLGSSIMNASGPRSAKRGEIYELCAVHSSALVFKSCNLAGLEAPENLKNRGVEHFAAIARDLVRRGKTIVGSAVGATEEELVVLARTLDRAGVQIVELNLADAYVIDSIAPFASLDRLKELLGRVRGEIGAVMAVKLPMQVERKAARTMADLLKAAKVAIAVCNNDLPKELAVELASGTVEGPRRPLSQAHALFLASDGALDVVATGGVGSGRDAYIAHLTGATAVQVGSALIKEGAGALGRIDRELDALLAENGKRSVAEIIGRMSFRV